MRLLRRRARPTAPVLPDGSHVAVTWDIPDNFGGLTKAMLQRTCLFAEHTQRPMAVMTLALRPDLDDIRADLRRRELLVDGVELVNMWEQLREWDDARIASAAFDDSVAEPEPLVGDGDEQWSAHGRPLARIHRHSERAVEVEVLRDDGSLLARQAWMSVGTRAPLTPFGDWATNTSLWTRDGRFAGGWHGMWGLWRHWLAEQLGDEPTHAIVDSPYVADFVAHSSLPSLTTMFVVHNNHLPPRRIPPYGPVGHWRRHASEHADGFDGFVFLTHQQHDDFVALLGPRPNAHVIANAKQPPRPHDPVERDERRGVAMANFAPRKRLDHAVRAIKDARVDGASLHLYGAGSREQELRDLIARIDAPAVIEGYTSNPDEVFAQSSFMLLSSTNEGLPLVLAEAMTNGCVPIAYDIPYGPSDVITDGVDGFLAPAGDRAALARRVREFLELAPARREAMRSAARKRAADFDAPPIIARWNSALLRAQRVRSERSGSVSTPTELHELERQAQSTRLAEPLVSSELLGVDWTTAGRAVVTLRCTLTGGLGGERLPGPISVAVQLVHRPTNTWSDVATLDRPDLLRPNDPESSSVVDATIDLATLLVPSDHVLMVTARHGVLWARDAVLGRRSIDGWPWLGPADVSRPAFEHEAQRGIALVTASPKVVADVSLDGDHVEAALRVLAAGTVEIVEAVGIGRSTTVPAALDGDIARLELPVDGRWKLQAVVDGTRRDVAWAQATSDGPRRTTGPLQLELTPRGYVRLDRSAERAALEVVEPLGPLLRGSSCGDVVIVAEGLDHSTEATGAAWALDTRDLPPGTYRLRVRGASTSDLSAATSLQGLLPLSGGLDGRHWLLRRRGDRDAYSLVIG